MRLVGFREIAPGLLLCGCTLVAGEPPAIDVEPPAEWSAGATVPGDARPDWWRRFDDARLDELIGEALRGNRDLRALAERVAMAEARARIAGAELFPRLSGGFTAARQKQVFVGFPIPGTGGGVLDRTFTSYGVSLDVSWEVDLWGRLRSRSQAAAADFRAARSDWLGARLSLIAQTCKAWFALSEATRQLELARGTVENYQRVAEIVTARFRAGARPEIDVRLTRSTLMQAEADLAAREELIDRACRQLELLVGRYPAGAQSPGPLPALPEVPPTGVPAEVIDRRPDLRASRQRLLAAHARAGEARAALYPRISLIGGTGTVGNDLADLLDGDFHVWNILGNLVQPLFQGGRLRAAVDLAEATRREATVRFADDVLRAFFEVESALAAEGHLRRQREAIERLVAETDAARRIATDRYRQGRGGLLEMLSAERNSVSAQSALISVQRRELTSRIDLHVALGGGFETEPGETHGEEAER